MSDNYMSDYMLNRYHERRKFWIAELGGVCNKCSQTERLEFDHIDRETKKYDIAKILATWSPHIIEEEMRKCQLLCRSCHAKKSAAELAVDHGGGVSGKKNCPCALCKSRRSEYNRNYRLKQVNPPKH